MDVRFAGAGSSEALMRYLADVMAPLLGVDVAVARAGLDAAHGALVDRDWEGAVEKVAALWFPGQAKGALLATGLVEYAAERARMFRRAEAAPVPADLVEVVVGEYRGKVSAVAAAAGLHAVTEEFDGTGFGSETGWADAARAAAREWGLFAGRGKRGEGPVVTRATGVLRRVVAAAM
jgi:hypothetical protein